jgi:hypothetical protein
LDEEIIARRSRESSGLARARRRIRRILANVLIASAATVLTLVVFDLVLRQYAFFGPRSGTLEPEMEGFSAITDRTFAMSPGYSGVLNGRDFSNIAIRINQHGFRDAEMDLDAVSTRQPVLFVGDSYFFGWGVDESDRVSDRVRTRLSEASLDNPIMNVAAPGWGTYQYLDVLENVAHRIDVGLAVIGFFVGNDFLDDIRTRASMNERERMAETQASPRRKFSLRRFSLREYLRTSPVFNLVKYSLWGLETFRRLFDRLEIRNDRIALYQPLSEHDRELLYGPTLTAFSEIAEFSRESDTPVLVVLIPDHIQVLAPQILNEYDAGQPQRILSRHLEALELPFVDLLPRLFQEPERERLYFREDKHWSAAGHAFVADIIGAAIRDGRLDRRAPSRDSRMAEWRTRRAAEGLETIELPGAPRGGRRGDTSAPRAENASENRHF